MGVDDGCCTEDNPCGDRDGDCDNDSQCAGSLVCGTDNCPWGDADDCCMAPGKFILRLCPILIIKKIVRNF